jgi:membrane protease YdiL (CAAX protease family)
VVGPDGGSARAMVCGRVDHPRPGLGRRLGSCGSGRSRATSRHPLLPALISGLLAGMLEEFGWSGFAFPTLQARYGFLRAGVAVGCIVAVWHLPFFFTPGTTQSRSSFLVFLLTLIPARIIFGWIYNGSGGSILLTVLLHASGNAWSEVLGQGPAVADAAGLTVMLVFWAVAVGVLLKNRTPAPRQA